jgi:ankyrin repeat protein
VRYLKLLGLLFAALPVAALPQTANINSDLLLAARKGNEAIVRALLDQGASLNSRNRLGDTPRKTATRRWA